MLPNDTTDTYRTPFFMLFPWTKAAIMLALMYIGSMFVYRLSYAGGPETSRACFAAMALSLAACTAAVYPIAKFWGQDQWRMLLGIFLGNLIRLLIGAGGVAIILYFTTINQILFVLFLKFYYFFFLIGDTWLAAWILRHSREPNRKRSVNGNLWDIVERI